MIKPKNTTTISPILKIDRAWHLIDLEGQVLGRVATQIAVLLMGKLKVSQNLNHDWGDYVVAINSDKIKVTGNKLKQKIYYHHSGYPGNLKELSLKALLEKDSTRVLELAVKNMLPKNKLRQVRLSRLKIFKDEKHNFSAQLKNAKN